MPMANPPSLNIAPSKSLNAQLGAGFNKKTADKVYIDLNGTEIVLTENEIKATDTVYIKNCNNCQFIVDAMCTKLFVEGCKQVDLHLNGRIITHTVEIWRSDFMKTKISTSVQTLQIDLCNDIDIEFSNSSHFNRVVWSATENFCLNLVDIEDKSNGQLKTGTSVMAKLNPEIKAEMDQFIVRLLPHKLTGKMRLLNELVVRLENGFPTTEREARQFEERQEANLQALAKELMGKDFVIGKKKDSGVKIGRNDPCKCGSGKKFKKCCGTDVL